MHTGEEEFFSRYPFTTVAKEYLAKASPPLDEKAVVLGYERVKLALNMKPEEFGVKKIGINAIDELVSYAAARMLISALGSEYAISRYAVAEAKRAKRYLDSEDSWNIKRVADDVGVIFSEEEKYAVPFYNYLRFSPREKQYKLVNQELKFGNVLLSRNKFIRILEEAIRRKIEKSLPIDSKSIPENATRYANELRGLIAKPVRTQRPATFTKFAPCIERLLERMKRGENLPHIARWSLAVYLNSIGLPMDKIMDLFRMSPDFSEKITKYQLEHIKRRGYRMPSCSAMSSYGLCVAKCGVKNPMLYGGNRWKTKSS